MVVVGVVTDATVVVVVVKKGTVERPKKLDRGKNCSKMGFGLIILHE